MIAITSAKASFFCLIPVCKSCQGKAKCSISKNEYDLEKAYWDFWQCPSCRPKAKSTKD